MAVRRMPLLTRVDSRGSGDQVRFNAKNKSDGRADVPKVLSQPDVDGYRRNGYHFPVDVLSADEVAGFRRKLEDYEAASGGHVPGGRRHRRPLPVPWFGGGGA